MAKSARVMSRTASVKGPVLAYGETGMMCRCSKSFMASALSVTTSGGVTTITVPSDIAFLDGVRYGICLLVDVPVGTNGTQVNVTNGSVTYSVMNRFANYWRPKEALKKGMVLSLAYLADPAHFLVRIG